MVELRYSLISDGSSDAALLPILSWLLRESGVQCAIQPSLADLRRLPAPPSSLEQRISVALDLYPCDLLFVHRDAERQPLSHRKAEVQQVIYGLKLAIVPSWVCVIPVRMTEAWLLFDEVAIRHAAGNRSGRQPLDLPRLSELEDLPDPKYMLYDCLRRASGLHGTRLKRFRVTQSAVRVSSLITDFSPLRRLPAFKELEADLKSAIERAGWATGATV
jgi:hypothetical protein